MWWCNFEEMLARIDFLHLMKSKNGNALGFMKTRNLLKGSLPPLFGRWIKNIGCSVEPDKSLGIDVESKFFSFNYTLLLEKVYGVNENNVWHIHNSIIKADDIIVGHDCDYRDLFVRMNQFRDKHPDEHVRMDIADIIIKEVANGAKKVKERIAQNDDRFYNQYSAIKHFVIMGFSLNDIDLPYIKKLMKINSNIDDADWTLFYYQDGEDEKMINKLLSIGIKRENIVPPKKW